MLRDSGLVAVDPIKCKGGGTILGPLGRLNKSSHDAHHEVNYADDCAFPFFDDSATVLLERLSLIHI